MCEMDEAWCNAQRWLWKSRKHAPANADIWDFRFKWQSEQSVLWERVNNLSYRLSPMRVYRRNTGDSFVQWNARDALVLKWAAYHAQTVLPVHEGCEHYKGNGGAAVSVRRLHCALSSGEYQYVLRTDIRGYYRHIIKMQLWNQIHRYVKDMRVAVLIRQYLNYCVDDGGEIHTPVTGIPRGCALSPLLGASLLYFVDAGFNLIEDVYYARYMDDFMVLTRTRWRLRQCVAKLNGYFELRGFEKHPQKTFIGRIEHGFDWLGVVFNEHGTAGIADRALTHHQERCLEVYERACRDGLSHKESLLRVQKYRKRWERWARRMLGDPSYTSAPIQ